MLSFTVKGQRLSGTSLSQAVRAELEFLCQAALVPFSTDMRQSCCETEERSKGVPLLLQCSCLPSLLKQRCGQYDRCPRSDISLLNIKGRE